MRSLIIALLFCAARLAAADYALEAGPELVAGQNDAEWQALFKELGATRTIQSTFTEHRWFPIKKIPVVLRGELRLQPGRGISLHYTEPEDRTIVMDAKGLLIREAGGKEREVPSDPRAPAASTALLPILCFDQEAIARTFTVYAARKDGAWRLDFVPRDERLAGTIGRIIARGDGMIMEQLEFRRSAMQRVEIFIEKTRWGEEIAPAELKRFFR